MLTPTCCECCPIKQDPCNGLVVDVFPPIFVVVIGGIFIQIILKYLPETQTLIPSWASFLLKILVEIVLGYFIQKFSCIRNMWKAPSCNGIIALFFLFLFIPLLLPFVLRVL